MHFRIEIFFQKQTDTFSLFLDEFLSTAPEAIYCSLTCSHPSTFFLHKNILFYNTLFIFNFNLINHKGVVSLSWKIGPLENTTPHKPCLA